MWYWYMSEGRVVKSHGCDESLKDDLIEDLQNRHASEVEKEDYHKNLRFEPHQNTIFFGGQPSMEFEVKGKVLKMYCKDVSSVCEYLSESVLKKFSSGKEYYKLYSTYTCLVLTPEEREELLFQLRGKSDEADEAYSSFLDEFKKNMRPVKDA